MSDRSDEVTESRDTDDLLAETERLLSDSGGGEGGKGGEPRAPADDGAGAETERSRARAGLSTPDVSLGDESPEPEPDAASRSSRLSRFKPGLSAGDYFSPKAFLALVLLLGAGLFSGNLVLPFGGRVVGMFAVAFAIGLLASKRRYLEMAAAGTSVGAVSALAGNAMLAFAGSFQAVVAVGVTAGLGACLVGYYFGRDLRNGLVRDIE